MKWGFFCPLYFSVCFLFWKIPTLLPRHLTKFYRYQWSSVEYPGCCKYKVMPASSLMFTDLPFLLSDHVSCALWPLSASDRDHELVMFLANGPASEVWWLSMWYVCPHSPASSCVCTTFYSWDLGKGGPGEQTGSRSDAENEQRRWSLQPGDPQRCLVSSLSSSELSDHPLPHSRPPASHPSSRKLTGAQTSVPALVLSPWASVFLFCKVNSSLAVRFTS